MCLEFVFFGQGVVVVLLFGSLGIFFGVLQESNITMAFWGEASLSKVFAGIFCKK